MFRVINNSNLGPWYTVLLACPVIQRTVESAPNSSPKEPNQNKLSPSNLCLIPIVRYIVIVEPRAQGTLSIIIVILTSKEPRLTRTSPRPPIKSIRPIMNPPVLRQLISRLSPPIKHRIRIHRRALPPLSPHTHHRPASWS